MRILYKNTIRECTTVELLETGLNFYYNGHMLFLLRGLPMDCYKSIMLEVTSKGFVNLSNLPESSVEYRKWSY